MKQATYVDINGRTYSVKVLAEFGEGSEKLYWIYIPDSIISYRTVSLDALLFNVFEPDAVYLDENENIMYKVVDTLKNGYAIAEAFVPSGIRQTLSPNASLVRV